MDLETILRYVKRTNPEITEAKLIKELCINCYSAAGFIITINGNKKGQCA